MKWVIPEGTTDLVVSLPTEVTGLRRELKSV